MASFRSITASAIILLSLACAAVPATKQLRAIYLVSNHFQDDSTSDNSDAGLRFYKQLGYNTVFEFISPAFGEWDRENPRQWNMKEPSRSKLIEYIRNEKKRIESFGLAFCPFYAEWGWGGQACSISERARASVYREVAYDTARMGQDIYLRLPKSTEGWASQLGGTYSWNSDHTIASIIVYRPSCLQATSITTDINDTAIQGGQCYEFSAEIELTRVKPSDIVKAVIYREFSNGEKPDPANIPAGRVVNPHNNWIEAGFTSYKIINQTAPDRYEISKEFFGQTESNVSRVTLIDSVWIENELLLGAGGHAFNKKLKWEFILHKGNRFSALPSEIQCTKFSVKKLDPLKVLAYPEWETSPQFGNYCSLYPSEKYMSTTLVYTCGKDTFKTVYGAPLARPATLNRVKAEMKLQCIKGHFKPLCEDIGAPCFRLPVDPLSPASDLIAREMLAIIKQGLNNEEPSCYFLGGDEVFVYRKDAVSRKGLNNTSYNSLSNGEYYGAVMKKNIERYRAIFSGNDASASRTTFAFWADMILPFGRGYCCYAEKKQDTSALRYLKGTIGARKIMPVIWVYDYMQSLEKPGTFMVKNSDELQQSIDFCTSSGFPFGVCYATDGTLQDLRGIDNLLDSDTRHIRHEIECARAWCDIAQTPANAGSLGGFIFTGWNGKFLSNGWNGLVGLAYFGWMKPGERDLPEQWKTVRKQLDQNGQPVLELLEKKAAPPRTLVPH